MQTQPETAAHHVFANLRVGLTGGIAAGKSTVAQRLADHHGALVIDADALVRHLQSPGQRGLAAITEAFGPEILTAEGELDRAALGALVFADQDARAQLNEILHPMVREEAAALKAQARPGQLVVEDIPLLVETGQAESFDEVMVVQAPHAERIRRMVIDRGMTPEEAEARIQAQATDAQRRAAATYILDNHGSVEQLQQATDDAVHYLHKRANAG